jgi:hypothetical protein
MSRFASQIVHQEIRFQDISNMDERLLIRTAAGPIRLDRGRYDADGPRALPARLAALSPRLRRPLGGRVAEGGAHLNSAVCLIVRSIGPLSAVSGACPHVELEQIKRPKRDRARQRITDVRRPFSADYCSPIPIRSVELHGHFSKPWRKVARLCAEGKRFCAQSTESIFRNQAFQRFLFSA